MTLKINHYHWGSAKDRLVGGPYWIYLVLFPVRT